MIRIEGLYAGYGKSGVLKDICLSCERGRITSLIGPNGSGKSTLLKTVMGILDIDSGDIKVDGVSVKDMNERERAKKIAYLSQEKNIPDISVERMVLHGRFPYLSYPRRYTARDIASAEAAMKKMGIYDIAKKPLSKLSGGTRRKVYIAMALCGGSDVLLLDEPDAYLDIAQKIKMAEIYRELAKEGKTVLTVSHDIIAAVKNSDMIAVMNEGRIVEYATPEAIASSGIIKKVFGVELLPINNGERTEYCYKSGD